MRDPGCKMIDYFHFGRPPIVITFTRSLALG
jgi:hypothetical protein